MKKLEPKAKPEARTVQPQAGARTDWQKHLGRFLVLVGLYGTVVCLALLVPPIRAHLRSFLVSPLGGKVALVCTVVGATIALLNGFFQTLFADIENANHRISFAVSFIITSCLVIGGLSAYWQDKDRALEAQQSTQETLKLLTGGDSYPFIVPETHHGALDFVVYNSGKYELYDIFLEVINETATEQLKAAYQAKGMKFSIKDAFGQTMWSTEGLNIVGGGNKLFIGVMPIPSSIQHLEYTANFLARNTSVQEKMFFSRVKANWNVRLEIVPKDHPAISKELVIPAE